MLLYFNLTSCYGYGFVQLLLDGYRYKLLSDENLPDGVERGEVELSIHWRYDPVEAEKERKLIEKEKNSARYKLTKGLKSVSNLVTGDENDSDMEESEDVSPCFHSK